MADEMQRYDIIAGNMRAYYEANKPLRWWQRHRVWEKCTADNLMLGLLEVAERGLRR